MLVLCRHEAFEFFEPIEDDVDLGHSLPPWDLSLNHQELAAVRCDVVGLERFG
jgi:hypothetical protein